MGSKLLRQHQRKPELVRFSIAPFFCWQKWLTLTWRDRPGQPPADSWSADHNYVVEFPNGVNYEEPKWLSFVIKRTGGGENIDVALGSNADASQWGCHKEDGTQVCIFTGDLIVTPYSP